MAAAEVDLGLGGFERYDTLSQEIEMRFHELHSLLETRKVRLLDRVRDMKELCQKHIHIDRSIKQMEVAIRATSDAITENLIAGCKEQAVGLWTDKIRDLRRDKAKLDTVCELRFVPNSVEVFACINRIHLRDCGDVEFIKRREPLVMTGKRGGSEGEIYRAYGIAVDREIDLVFVADCYKHLISIYSMEGDFIKSFGKEKLGAPYGICLFEEFVFVTERSSNSVVKFLRSGDFVCDSKSQNKDTQIDSPSSLCVLNQSVYVCDKAKHRIALFNLDLLFIRSFGEFTLRYPEDIKTHKNTIFVLTQTDNSIHTFNTQHRLICSIPLTGPNYASISNAFFFAIDLNGNFVISDIAKGCLKVFSPTGQYVDSLGDGYLAIPQGIAIARLNRIVSVSESSINCFQIY